MNSIHNLLLLEVVDNEFKAFAGTDEQELIISVSVDGTRNTYAFDLLLELDLRLAGVFNVNCYQIRVLVR